jgi:hypothetical protein
MYLHCLQRLPCLRELLLPSFRPALPHEHLPALARLPQLEALTVSVQVRAVCLHFNVATAAGGGYVTILCFLSAPAGTGTPHTT